MHLRLDQFRRRVLCFATSAACQLDLASALIRGDHLSPAARCSAPEQPPRPHTGGRSTRSLKPAPASVLSRWRTAPDPSRWLVSNRHVDRNTEPIVTCGASPCHWPRSDTAGDIAARCAAASDLLIPTPVSATNVSCLPGYLDEVVDSASYTAGAPAGSFVANSRHRRCSRVLHTQTDLLQPPVDVCPGGGISPPFRSGSERGRENEGARLVTGEVHFGDLCPRERRAQSARSRVATERSRRSVRDSQAVWPSRERKGASCGAEAS